MSDNAPTIHFREILQDDEFDGKNWRLRLEYEGDGSLVEFAEECCTSTSEKAQVLDGEQTRFWLTEEDVEWLHGALGRLLARKAARANASPPVSP